MKPKGSLIVTFSKNSKNKIFKNDPTVVSEMHTKGIHLPVHDLYASLKNYN
jgi:hypothetical protein